MNEHTIPIIFSSEPFCFNVIKTASTHYMREKKREDRCTVLTVLSFRLSCPINFLSSAGSMMSPPMKSSILVCALLALIRLRMQRLTEPMVSLVWDQMSRSSTCRPWFGNRTMRVMCFPRNALQKRKHA